MIIKLKIFNSIELNSIKLQNHYGFNIIIKTKLQKKIFHLLWSYKVIPSKDYVNLMFII
jgi:hypothetical protein